MKKLITSSIGNYDQYIHAIKKLPFLTREEENDLAIKANQGDEAAANKLITSHLRAVPRVVNMYTGYGFPREDLVQEGNIGLMKCVKSYVPDKDVRFITYALYGIRYAILDYIRLHWGSVKFPRTKNMQKLFFNLRTLHQSDKSMTSEEIKRIAEELNVKEHEVIEMEKIFQSKDISIYPDSSSDEETAPVEYLAIHESEQPDQILYASQLETAKNELIQAALDKLDVREKEIIMLRWLVDEDDIVTFSEFAEKYDISSARAAQLEKRALKKIKQFMLDRQIN